MDFHLNAILGYIEYFLCPYDFSREYFIKNNIYILNTKKNLYVTKINEI